MTQEQFRRNGTQSSWQLRPILLKLLYLNSSDYIHNKVLSAIPKLQRRGRWSFWMGK